MTSRDNNFFRDLVRQNTAVPIANIPPATKGRRGKKRGSVEKTSATPAVKSEACEDDTYRDRAKERREGREIGSAGSITDETDPIKTKRDIPSSWAGLIGSEMTSKLTAEETKYLGGTEATTHLVKGLDVALLAKNKENNAKSQLKVEDPLQRRSSGVPMKQEPLQLSQSSQALVAIMREHYSHAQSLEVREQRARMAIAVAQSSWKISPVAGRVPVKVFRSQGQHSGLQRHAPMSFTDNMLRVITDAVNARTDGLGSKRVVTRKRRKLGEEKERESGTTPKADGKNNAVLPVSASTPVEDEIDDMFA